MGRTQQASPNVLFHQNVAAISTRSQFSYYSWKYSASLTMLWMKTPSLGTRAYPKGTFPGRCLTHKPQAARAVSAFTLTRALSPPRATSAGTRDSGPKAALRMCRIAPGCVRAVASAAAHARRVQAQAPPKASVRSRWFTILSDSLAFITACPTRSVSPQPQLRTRHRDEPQRCGQGGT